jgi:Tol biopolymer transport system component
MRSDGTGNVSPLTISETPPRQRPYSFSPDGKWLVFSTNSAGTQEDLWALPLEDAQSEHPKAGKPLALLNTRFNETAPMISPDGKWMAYQSDETTTDQVYVRSFPGPGKI